MGDSTPNPERWTDHLPSAWFAAGAGPVVFIWTHDVGIRHRGLVLALATGVALGSSRTGAAIQAGF